MDGEDRDHLGMGMEFLENGFSNFFVIFGRLRIFGNEEVIHLSSMDCIGLFFYLANLTDKAVSVQLSRGTNTVSFGNIFVGLIL